jgi:hypothetical protein
MSCVPNVASVSRLSTLDRSFCVHLTFIENVVYILWNTNLIGLYNAMQC